MYYVQVDLARFLASGTFFLGRHAAERATKSQGINSSFLTLNQEINTSMSPGWITWTIFLVARGQVLVASGDRAP